MGPAYQGTSSASLGKEAQWFCTFWEHSPPSLPRGLSSGLPAEGDEGGGWDQAPDKEPPAPLLPLPPPPGGGLPAVVPVTGAALCLPRPPSPTHYRLYLHWRELAGIRPSLHSLPKLYLSCQGQIGQTMGGGVTATLVMRPQGLRMTGGGGEPEPGWLLGF